MSIKCVIRVQYKENYGAHCWDGEGECPQAWKNKGGETLVITGLNPREAQYIESRGLPRLSSIIDNCKGVSYAYEVVDYYLADDSSWQDELPDWPILHREEYDCESSLSIAEQQEEFDDAYDAACRNIFDLKYSMTTKQWYARSRYDSLRQKRTWEPLKYYMS